MLSYAEQRAILQEQITSANVDARGPFQWVFNQILRNQLDKLVGEFTKCVATKVGEAKSPA